MYEIHLTMAPVAATDWPALERYASCIGAKLMVIELARGDFPVQPMLTLARAGRLDEVIAIARALARAASAYHIVRCKIEQDAYASSSAIDAGALHYFEWHGKLTVPEAARAGLAALCQQFGGHLSNNAIRGGNARYVTLRESVEFSSLERRVAALCNAMAAQGWVIDKQQWERVVFDSNLALDAGWLEPKHEN